MAKISINDADEVSYIVRIDVLESVIYTLINNYAGYLLISLKQFTILYISAKQAKYYFNFFKKIILECKENNFVKILICRKTKITTNYYSSNYLTYLLSTLYKCFCIKF